MTLDQQRAALAFRHLQELGTTFPPESLPRKSYGSFACKLPALLRTAGLCQALHFLASRNQAMANLLLDHLAEQLRRIDTGTPVPGQGAAARDGLCQQAREAELASYLWLSREAVAVATWYARLAKSELGYEPGAEDEP